MSRSRQTEPNRPNSEADRWFLVKVEDRGGRMLATVRDGLSGGHIPDCPILMLGGGASSLSVPMVELDDPIEVVVLFTRGGRPVVLGSLARPRTTVTDLETDVESPYRGNDISKDTAWLRTSLASVYIDDDGAITLKAKSLRFIAPLMSLSLDGDPGDIAVGAERLGDVLLDIRDELAAHRDMLNVLCPGYIFAEQAKGLLADKEGIGKATAFLASPSGVDVSVGRYGIQQILMP